MVRKKKKNKDNTVIQCKVLKSKVLCHEGLECLLDILKQVIKNKDNNKNR